MTTTTADKGEQECREAFEAEVAGKLHLGRSLPSGEYRTEVTRLIYTGWCACWNRRPTNEGQDGLTDEDILKLLVGEGPTQGSHGCYAQLHKEGFIAFARAIERALNQRLTVKEGGGLVGELRKAFPLYNDPREINEDDYPSEWVLLTERKRLHEFLSSHPASDDQQAKDAVRTIYTIVAAAGGMVKVAPSILITMSNNDRLERYEELDGTIVFRAIATTKQEEV